jgi:hypothetical protein
MKKKLVFPAMLVCLAVLGLVLVGCPTEDDDSGGGTNSDTNLIGKWIGGDGEDQFEFTANIFVFTIDGGFGTFSGTYTYEHTTLRMVCNITNGTGFGSIMVGEKYDVNISWQDEDNFTVTKVNSTSEIGGPSTGETWKRQ